jgi:hypothetical protein
MAQGVACRRLRNARQSHGFVDRFLDRVFVQMMSTNFASARIFRKSGRWKNVLPRPLPIGVRKFPAQRFWQINSAVSRAQSGAVNLLHPPQMRFQNRFNPLRQHRDAIFPSFSVPDRNLVERKIDIFDS